MGFCGLARITSSHSLTTVLFVNPNDVLSRRLLFSRFLSGSICQVLSTRFVSKWRSVGLQNLEKTRPCSSAQSKLTSLSWTNWRCSSVAQLFVPAGFLVIIRFCAQDFRAWGEVQDREAADDGRIPAPWCWTCHFPDQYHRGCWGMLKNEGGLFQFCWTKYSLLCSQRCLPRWLKKRNASHWRCATPHLTW